MPGHRGESSIQGLSSFRILCGVRDYDFFGFGFSLSVQRDAWVISNLNRHNHNNNQNPIVIDGLES